MKGTEKQIAYAAKLLDNMNVQFNNLIADCPQELKANWITLLDGINSIASESYAGYVIDALKIWDADYAKYYNNFYYNVKFAHNAFAESVMELIAKLS